MTDGIADDPTTPDIPACVARGALLLDRVRPGWWREINDDELNMAWCRECVLGQIFGDYFRGVDHLPIPRFKAPEYGFDLQTETAFEETWVELDNAWRAEIARRADAAQEVTP
jgi:hypothetical protein